MDCWLQAKMETEIAELKRVGRGLGGWVAGKAGGLGVCSTGPTPAFSCAQHKHLAARRASTSAAYAQNSHVPPQAATACQPGRLWLNPASPPRNPPCSTRPSQPLPYPTAWPRTALQHAPVSRRLLLTPRNRSRATPQPTLQRPCLPGLLTRALPLPLARHLLPRPCSPCRRPTTWGPSWRPPARLWRCRRWAVRRSARWRGSCGSCWRGCRARWSCTGGAGALGGVLGFRPGRMALVVLVAVQRTAKLRRAEGGGCGPCWRGCGAQVTVQLQRGATCPRGQCL